MVGRYGIDDFGKFLLIFGLVVSILGRFIPFVWLLSYAVLGYAIFRALSKKIHLRMGENRKYLVYQNKAIMWYQKVKQRFDQRKTHKYFKCTACKQTVRVPKGRGKIKITCPKCQNSFVKKT